MLDTLILIAVVQSNVAPLNRNADLALTYADYEGVPPDDLRRRVSISAIAQSLRQPYETVRRRITALAAQGHCVVTPHGVYVPAERVSSPEHHRMLQDSYERVRTFYLRLRDLGMLTDLPNPAPRSAVAAGEPVRAVARASSDYALRVLDLTVTHVGDVVRGLILLTILSCNTEHLTDEQRGGDQAGAEGFVPDALRRPVRIATIGESLGVPEETTRRHANRLVADGLVVRVADGLIVPAEVLARPAFMHLMAENQAYVRRMFEVLARLGILAEWERGPGAETA
ncbi:hypothetical protein [Phenylobacterium sp. J367]|uniref:hypothetical protein n=1 Tax=Phenylobacterium sp. J367 TaxID=2898435 RepID=UPI002151D83C|nr:hypothetical protein [Phenylobacterium sp. J367]MCR5878763.1 hypothetical protein [Phenylobacterium sp. J367]